MMQIRRQEFLRLTVLLAACTPAPEQAVITVPMQPAPSASQAAAKPDALPPKPTPEKPDEPDPTDPPDCVNAKGAPIDKICLKVPPTCEGLREDCKGLVDDLRPRVAEKWATCFANSGRKCRNDFKKIGACMREAVASACIEPGTIQKCRELRKACREAGNPPAYTLEQCVRVLSATKTGKTGADWWEVDIERLGPSGPAEEASCNLDYVLPFQPFGDSWK